MNIFKLGILISHVDRNDERYYEHDTEYGGFIPGIRYGELRVAKNSTGRESEGESLYMPMTLKHFSWPLNSGFWKPSTSHYEKQKNKHRKSNTSI